MRYRREALIHPVDFFNQSTILERKNRLGLTNEARIELFLWDLEMFCQIYKRLGDRLVLKGGAAAQLFLPVDWQRTSVDIDMLCRATEEEIRTCLDDVENAFMGEGDLLKFRPHRPKNAKTELPLLTFFLTVPSEVITDNNNKGVQEIKLEFFLDKEEWPSVQLKSPEIFAMETGESYRVLTLEALIADKLTTLGPNTVGIPDFRRDELCKHLYDLDTLLHFPNEGTHNIVEVKELYFKRAELECESRKIAFIKEKIAADVVGWLNSLFLIDFRKDTQLEKDINDFQSLYLRKTINRGKSQWAIIGEKLRFYLANLWADVPSENVWKEALELESLLLFNELEGKARGEVIKRFKNSFSEAFSKYSISPQKMLKGKNPSRQMWHVISPSNISEIKSWISVFLKDLRNL